MKYLLALCLLVGCTDTFKEDPGWDARAATVWAKNMGEAEPKVVCNHWDHTHKSWCDVVIKDHIYTLVCYHNEGCWKE